MTDTGQGHEEARWWLRGLLEQAGLRVLDLRPFPDRPYRWSVHVLADETTEHDIRALATVDVVRYRQLPGDPGRLVVTVDEPTDPIQTGTRPSVHAPTPYGSRSVDP